MVTAVRHIRLVPGALGHRLDALQLLFDTNVVEYITQEA